MRSDILDVVDFPYRFRHGYTGWQVEDVSWIQQSAWKATGNGLWCDGSAAVQVSVLWSFFGGVVAVVIGVVQIGKFEMENYRV